MSRYKLDENLPIELYQDLLDLGLDADTVVGFVDREKERLGCQR